MVKESKANENNAGIRRFFVLCLDKRYISQVIHFKKSLFPYFPKKSLQNKKSPTSKLYSKIQKHRMVICKISDHSLELTKVLSQKRIFESSVL